MTRAAIVVLVAVLVLGGLFVLLRPEAPSGAPHDRKFDISVKGGEMSPDEISADENDTLMLRVSTDKPIELHIHGYDVEQKVKPGREAEVDFKADLTGRFEIEDHESEKELGVLQVRPR